MPALNPHIAAAHDGMKKLGLVVPALPEGRPIAAFRCAGAAAYTTKMVDMRGVVVTNNKGGLGPVPALTDALTDDIAGCDFKIEIMNRQDEDCVYCRKRIPVGAEVRRMEVCEHFSCKACAAVQYQHVGPHGCVGNFFTGGACKDRKKIMIRRHKRAELAAALPAAVPAGFAAPPALTTDEERRRRHAHLDIAMDEEEEARRADEKVRQLREDRARAEATTLNIQQQLDLKLAEKRRAEQTALRAMNVVEKRVRVEG